MLTDLNIRNFAIIDKLHVDFGPGFNVLTGETGAGKSILLGALGLMLGDRARTDIVRSGEEEAAVEAVFRLQDDEREEVLRLLDEAGINIDDDEVLIRRLVSRSGKNRIFINGSLVTLAQLQPIAERLVTIYGQHEHQSLLRSETHLQMLDDFAQNGAALAEYRGHYEALQKVRDAFKSLQMDENERRRRMDLLSFQLQEISAANIKTGEDEELEAERRILQHAERLVAATAGGFERLYGAEGAACEQIAQSADELDALSSVDARLGQWAQELRNALYITEDIAVQLRSYGENLNFDPAYQEQVESRLALLAGLKRKYGGGLQEILVYGDRIQAELNRMQDIDGNRSDLQSRIVALEITVAQYAETLSQRRREAALSLAEGVEKELADLAMARARFQVVLHPLEAPGSAGKEKAEFHLAPNPGEELRPLARIASGGELSRIMLALRRAAPQQAGVATLVFDEVDAGIGGATATRVGEKLRALSAQRQVLCVTHLPQVAAFADRQYHIEKQEHEGRTRTAIRLLLDDDRIREMARMLGGARITERTLEHARELIHQSLSYG